MPVSREAVQAVVESRHGQPFDVLGPHVEEVDGKQVLTVRSFQPDASRLVVVNSDGEVLAEAEKVHPDGLFEAVLGERDPAAPYRLRFETLAGKTVELGDPYAFGPLLSDYDLHLLKEGTHFRVWEKLGSHLTTVRGVSGAHFAVWAPNAKRVSVVGDFNAWDGRRHPMRKHEHNGIWEIFIPGLVAGENYKFELKLQNDAVILKIDPYAFSVELPPKTAARLYDPSGFEWSDEDWMEKRRKWDYLRSPISIYEIHFGSWRHVPEEGSRSLTYREAAGWLGSYLQEMGFTHVELMPITEHPYYASWGYQTVNFFAPTSRYGSPKDLKHFINALHAQGIGVILDWVPAHFPADAHGLADFDGTHLYDHADPREGRHPDWDTLVFNWGRTEVWNFLLSNALFWLDEYHFDGLRVDAVASMLYRDYSRKQGQWIPNRFGGHENLEAIEFLKHLNVLVHTQHPGVLTIAEESTAWPGVSRPTYLGGLGFSLKWNMGWMHDILEFFQKNPVHRKYHANRLTFSMLYAYTENFELALSHDEVVHGKGALLSKMPGDEWQQRANLRALLGYMFGHPGKKMLFMGSEIGQRNEWNHDLSLDWNLLDFPVHRGIQLWVKDLNRLYRSEKSLYQRDFEPEGFRWIDCSDAERSIYSFIRYAEDRSDFLVFVCNLTPVPRYHYRVGVPDPGIYDEVLNSDASAYGGSNMGNAGAVHADAIPWQMLGWSLDLTLPPLSVLVLKRRRA